MQLSSHLIYIKKLSLCNDQGLSAVLSTWECYVDVVDILTESFDILIQFSANGDSSSSESCASGSNVAELKSYARDEPSARRSLRNR